MHHERWIFFLKDPRISLKAKGLMAVMDSLPEDCNHYLSTLMAICHARFDSKEAIKNALSELEQYGYIKTLELPGNRKSARKNHDYLWEIVENFKMEV